MNIENIDRVFKIEVDVVESGEKEFLRFGENSWFFYVDDSYMTERKTKPSLVVWM